MFNKLILFILNCTHRTWLHAVSIIQIYCLQFMPGRQSDILVQYLHLGLLLIFCRPEAVTCNSPHSCFMYSIYPSIIRETACVGYTRILPCSMLASWQRSRYGKHAPSFNQSKRHTHPFLESPPAKLIKTLVRASTLEFDLCGCNNHTHIRYFLSCSQYLTMGPNTTVLYFFYCTIAT